MSKDVKNDEYFKSILLFLRVCEIKINGYKYYNVLLQQSKKHAAKVRGKNGCVIILFIVLL